jgi:hypothetical protein
MILTFVLVNYVFGKQCCAQGKIYLIKIIVNNSSAHKGGTSMNNNNKIDKF